MNDGAETLAILNPVAGTASRRQRQSLIDFLRSNGRLILTEYAGHGEVIARRAAAEGCPIVIAAGGDGTVNEVARGLVGTQSALSIIPVGSGNGLGRHLKVPMNYVAARRRLTSPRIIEIDVGYINDRMFVCTAGIGFDGHISRHFAATGKRGLKTYLTTVLSRYRHYRPTAVSWSFDELERQNDCYLMAFANASQYGNDARIAPHADLADGKLDICHIGSLPARTALKVGWRLMRGTLPKCAEIAYHTSHSVRVSCNAPMEFHTDGDYAGEGRDFFVRLDPLALKVAI